MNSTIRFKLTTTNLKKISVNPPSSDIYDTEVKGFHIRPGSKGLTFRVFYRSQADKQRVYTIGRYGIITTTQARTEAIKILALVSQGIDPRADIIANKEKEKHSQKQTLKAYLEGPYTIHQSRKKAGEHTLAIIKHNFNDWLTKPMDSLDLALVEDWQALKEKQNKSYETLKRALGALNTLLNHATKKGTIEANPLKGIQLEKPAMTERQLNKAGSSRRYLEHDEVTSLFNALELYQSDKRQQRRNSRTHGKPHLPNLNTLDYVDHVKPFILTMLYTGFRPGDLFGLRWEHINFKFKTITKTIEKTAHHHPEPRTFPIGLAPHKILKIWWIQLKKPKEGYVFASSTGGRKDKKSMQKPWSKLRVLGNISNDLDLYTLRHNFASQLIMKGTDLLTVSRLMAHTDIQTTIKNYGHLCPDHTRAHVEEFCELYS